jgi:hypothetical protein
MSSLIPGLLIIASFLVASMIMFGTFLFISTTQSESLKDLGKVSRERAGSVISISSASITSSTPGSSTDITVSVDNTGSRSVADFNQMDVIVQYTDSSDNLVRRSLGYNDSGIGNNQWTQGVPGVTPDILNPGMWDSDETFTMDLRVAPDVKSGTSAVIVVGTPQAASDQTSVSN